MEFLNTFNIKKRKPKMQEINNAELLFGVLKNSIDIIEDDFARGRLNKRINNLMNSNSLNLDYETAINYAIDVRSSADRYNYELISEKDFIEAMKKMIDQLELGRTSQPSEGNCRKRT